MTVTTMAKALQGALRYEMAADDSVIMLGENVAAAGGSFGVTAGLLAEFGPKRVIDTPISEAGFVGMAIGAALCGMRPVVDMMFSDFTALAMDQLVNQGAYLRFMTGGQGSVPLVLRLPMGAGSSLGAQHSQSLHAWFAHVPGLKVVVPATPADAQGLLLSAIRDPDPVIFFEDKMEYGRRGEVPDIPEPIRFGTCRVHRPGRDVTVVATLSMVHVALQAAEKLAADGIEVEVVDPRTLTPLDTQAMVASASRTGRVVVVDEGYRAFGAGAEIAATISEQAFDYLEHPVIRLGGLDAPVAFTPILERAAIPDVAAVEQAVRSLTR